MTARGGGSAPAAATGRGAAPAGRSAARAEPPGPPRHRLLGNLPEFAADLLGFFTACAREHGGVASMRVAGRTAYLLTDPEAVEQVLVGQQRNFVKHSFFWRHVRAVFGEGLLTSEGDAWLARRRMIQPSFHRDRVVGYGRVMVAYADRMMDGWRDGATRDVHADMMALTLEIVAKVLFDSEVRDDVADLERALDDALHVVADRFRRPFPVPDWIPIPGNLRYRRAVRRMDALVYRFIREHEARPEPGDDLLSTLMEARSEDGEAMPERQIRDEAVTLLLAGHETTALALSWTWCLLSRHPEVEARLHEELDRVLRGRPPAPEDVPELRYTGHVVRETLRLFPPAYAIGREAVEDCEVAGWPTPAGTTLFMSPWVTHRDPRWFDDPEAFRPERWADGLAGRLPRFVYMPFGGGPRLCIGARFAEMETALILATVARRFRLRLEPDRMPDPFPTVTLRPQGGVGVRVQRRS